jgi:acyl dehydratase
MLEKCFDELHVGDVEITHRRTVTETDLTMWCMFTGDWFPIHSDLLYAEASVFKQRVAPGVMVFAMAGGLAVPAQTRSVIANYGTERIRYPNPTFIGDTLQVVATVERLQPRDADSGIADIRWEVNKQDDKTVCVITMRIWIRTRSAMPRASGVEDGVAS